MKYFSYLKVWEKLLLGFCFFADIYIFWMGIKGTLGIGFAVLLITIQQTLFTLVYRGLQRIPKSQLDDKLRKSIKSYESNKTLFLGFNLKWTAVLWVVGLFILLAEHIH